MFIVNLQENNGFFKGFKLTLTIGLYTIFAIWQIIQILLD